MPAHRKPLPPESEWKKCKCGCGEIIRPRPDDTPHSFKARTTTGKPECIAKVNQLSGSICRKKTAPATKTQAAIIKPRILPITEAQQRINDKLDAEQWKLNREIDGARERLRARIPHTRILQHMGAMI